MSINSNPNERRAFIENVLKNKGLFVNGSTTPLTNEQKIFAQAVKVWESVRINYARPLLKALQTSSQYDTVATQKLLLPEFERRFGSWSKDELVFLVSVMHTEELEKNMKQLVEQGLHGESMDKPI